MQRRAGFQTRGNVPHLWAVQVRSQDNLIDVRLARDCLKEAPGAAGLWVFGQLFWINCEAVAPVTIHTHQSALPHAGSYIAAQGPQQKLIPTPA